MPTNLKHQEYAFVADYLSQLQYLFPHLSVAQLIRFNHDYRMFILGYVFEIEAWLTFFLKSDLCPDRSTLLSHCQYQRKTRKLLRFLIYKYQRLHLLESPDDVDQLLTVMSFEYKIRLVTALNEKSLLQLTKKFKLNNSHQFVEWIILAKNLRNYFAHNNRVFDQNLWKQLNLHRLDLLPFRHTTPFAQCFEVIARLSSFSEIMPPFYFALSELLQADDRHLIFTNHRFESDSNQKPGVKHEKASH